MRALKIMIVAGEPSGDQLAAELARALCNAASPRPVEFFGAGGPGLAKAGVEVAFDLLQHAIIGLPSPAEYFRFRGFRNRLVALARERRPDVFIGVDFFGFNGSLARCLRDELPADARPRIVQFVSPQVWASRPGRARRMQQTHDLLLSILPFEKEWYARNAPGLRVEFVGHPMVDRHGAHPAAMTSAVETATPRVLLLPGSRPGEIHRHTPVLVQAAGRIAAQANVRLQMILPNDSLAELARRYEVEAPPIERVVGGLQQRLPGAALALASTGTVTLECAWFGVPFIALYRTSWLTYEIGRRIVTVKHLAMPNLLAGETITPEFIQAAATGENLASEALALLQNPDRLTATRGRLARAVATLGEPGTVDRAARHILGLESRPT